jgi:NAD(P)-dependent dehydrogenase (short-subunit alcohol dehydrogenase family)
MYSNDAFGGHAEGDGSNDRYQLPRDSRCDAGGTEAHENDGRIIMIGSCVGERMMTPGLVAHAATKGAVKMFTQGLSREVG